MSEVYSIAWSETASDKLIAQLTTLKTTMASDYDPTFSFIYDHHNVAKLELNAVSIALDAADPLDPMNNAGITGTGLTLFYIMNFLIRVHTDYSGGVVDTVSNMRLLNSIINWLKENRDLGGGYKILNTPNMVVDSEFIESASLGGEVTIVVSKAVQHPRS